MDGRGKGKRGDGLVFGVRVVVDISVNIEVLGRTCWTSPRPRRQTTPRL